MTQLSEVMEKITADYRHLSITSAELNTFLPVIKRLAQGGGLATFRVAKQLGYETSKARTVMRRMESLGYVNGHTNGSNNIIWELLPCTSTISPSLTASPAE